MTWTYNSLSGAISYKGAVQGQGYSGFGTGRNNPAMEAVADVGPIPAGKWFIVTPAYDDPHLGPCVMKLAPLDHDAHGRTLFRIHGNNITNDASHGCIILSHAVREMIANSTDHLLEVVHP